MAITHTFSIKNEDVREFEEFCKLKWRDKKSESELIVTAIKEYNKNHKEGNEQTTLDDPTICTPAFSRESKIIHDYFLQCKDSEFSFHKFKLNEWNHAFKQRYGENP